tara:strand:- start:849 stop:1820 length:972 start_codon:yes stop_codon:yes gene_type:complete
MAQITLNVGSNANDGTGDTLRSAMQNVNTMFTEVYSSSLFNEGISISGNNISATRSDDDLIFTPSGTGIVRIDNLTVDSNINITDNEIQTTQSNSDLVLSASGTGSVVIAKVDINGGAIDNTVIGGTTPAAGTFTTVNTSGAATLDGVQINDNTITTVNSNDDLELSGAGTGTVTVNGLKLPTADGSANQLLKTDGSGNFGFATASATLNHSDINDNSTTVASSSTSVIDTFASATYRSGKYYISISDATNSRFEIVEANLVHGPSGDSTTESFITVFGSTTNHSTGLATFTTDINNGNVRLLATNITNDSCVFKFQRTLIDV